MKELPDNPSWSLKRAVRAFYRDHYRCAKWLCWIELLRNPNDYYTLCWYANSLFFLGNDHKADSLYRHAIKIDPSLPLAHAGLGKIHYENALRIKREWSLFPSGDFIPFTNEADPEGFYSKEEVVRITTSEADARCGNRKVAVYELEKAAELDTETDDKLELLLMAAEIRCIIDNRDAITAYKRVLHMAPNCITAHFDLAGCYAATYKRKLALQEYEFIRDNAPELVADLESVLARFNIELKQKTTGLESIVADPAITKQVEKVLKNSNEAISPKALFSMGIGSNTAVFKALNALEKEGKMKRVRWGYYKWTGD